MPDTPAIVQRVKFFTARTTFIADSSIETISAIKFDAFIAPLFEDIEGIDRQSWELVDKLHAINTALDQQEERKKEGQIYLRLDADGPRLLLSTVYPQSEEGDDPPDGAA